MSERIYDHLVIGAGIIGASVAYNFAMENKNVILLEQFPLPHTRGSSHGQSRVIRMFYLQEIYLKLAKEAYKEWAKIEEDSGQKLYLKTGMIYEEATPYTTMNKVIPLLDKHGVDYKILSDNEMRTLYPQAVLPKGHKVVYEVDAGILRADLCLKTIIDLCRKYGCIVRDRCKVLHIIPGRVTHVITELGTYKTRSLVICTGPWSQKLLRVIDLELPLKPVRVIVNYWKEKHPSEYSMKNGFPCWTAILSSTLYAIPCMEYPNLMKVCYHSGTECDPDYRDKQTLDNDVHIISEYIRNCFPNLEDKPAIIETCMYTMTPDELSILDHHPEHRNIIICTGCSGTGFKIGPIMGKLIYRMATGMDLQFNIEEFSLKRFESGNNSPKSCL